MIARNTLFDAMIHTPHVLAGAHGGDSLSALSQSVTSKIGML